ncbi:MAG: hypothetical protein HY903_19760 [Deltaproteobacteria bacterium]|nr:hypothetical protein [Deltaproteobacteria bacterium]
MVGGYVPGSISAGDLRLFVTASGEPVRGLHASLPPAMLPDTTVRLRLAAGTPPLSPLTEYTLAVSDIDSAGGVNTFGGAPVTVSFTTAGQGDDSRPLFVPGAEVSLEVSGGGQIIIDGKLEISDDDPSLLGVELWHDGIFVTQMSAAPGQPGHFVVNDADGLVPGGVSIPEGWSDVTVAVDDGTHQVSMLMPVYLMPDAEIPTVTAPLAGALVDPAATGTLQLTWSHTPGLADRQLLAVADMTAIGGPPQFVGVTIVDPDATAFDLGGRWGALLQPGRTYLAAVIKQVARNGMYSAGTASIFGRSMVTFAVVDPTLGAISGSLTLRSPLGAAPLVMLFDSMPGPGTPPSAYVAARPVVGDELTWTYELANLADLSPGYFVLTRVDVLNNTVDGQPLTEEDDLMAYYGMPGAPAPVAITAGAEVTGIDLPVDNWPGRVHALLTSAQTIAGDLLFVLCPDTATSPPFDSSCSVVTQRTPLAANSADITAYNVGDGVYTAWVAFDQDGDGDLDLGLAREAAESPFTVNGDTQEVTFAIPAPPTGGIDGSVATPAGALGVAVVVYGRGVSPGPGVQPLYAVAATSADGGLSWSYSISYVAAGDYDVYAFIDLDDTPGPPDAVALPQPAAVTVATSVVVQDFTLPAGGFAGTVATPGGALGVMVAVYARGVTPGPGVPPLYAVAAVDLGGGLSWSYSIGSVTDGDYDVYAFIDLDGAGGPDGVAVPGPAPLTVAGGVVSQSFTF